MTAYYNENDPYAAQWLRNLIDAGHIARGDVDERSIVDVRAADLAGYTQCHFFAGIGGWSIALRLAGWPDDRSVWTGSCPCQPFSAAGAGKAADDERHLWPAWLPLIAECRPAIVFGEQVEAAIGWGWLDAVFSDLEAKSYACGAAVLPACSIGAPHIRQRLWFVADAHGWDASAARLQRGGQHGQRTQDGSARSLDQPERQRDGRGPGDQRRTQRAASGNGKDEGGWFLQIRDTVATRDMAHAAGRGFPEFGDASQSGSGGYLDGSGFAGELGNTDKPGLEGWSLDPGERSSERIVRSAGAIGFWSDAEWIACTDGKSRPVGPGSFPLGHGIPNRASKLRAYGNAIVPQVAAEFIRASVMDDE